jgi:hypothetical protein
MRQWVFASLALIWIGCGGSVDPKPSPLHKLCMEACAHVHAKNCYEAPAVDVANCDNECSGAQSLAGSPCTDENASLYACTAKATVTCGGNTGETPIVTGCDAEEGEVSKCESPGMSCGRAIGSDDICFQFGFSKFYVCSEGVFAQPECIQVTNTGFCCP